MANPMHSFTLVLAEFDLKGGNVVKLQYPAPIVEGIDGEQAEYRTPDETSVYMADQMLPDGLHLNEADTNIFFLNRKDRQTSLTIKAPPKVETAFTASCALAGLAVHDDDGRATTEEHVGFVAAQLADFRPLVLSTKIEDTSVSVMVGFMDKERTISEQTVVLSSCVDVSQTGPCVALTKNAPFPSISLTFPDDEEGAARDFAAALRAALGDLKETKSPTAEDAGRAEAQQAPVIRCFSVVQTRKDAKQVRGAVSRALAVCTCDYHVYHWRPLLLRVLEDLLDAGCDALGPAADEAIIKGLHEVMSSVLDQVQEHAASIPPSPIGVRPCIALSTLGDWDRLFRQYQVTWKGNPVLVSLPVLLPCESGFADSLIPSISVVELVRVFRERTMAVFNAVLCGRRVVFFGKLRPSHVVSRFVLAAAALVPSLPRVVEDRAHPYISISQHMPWRNCKELIAGATNPVIESRSDWWDVLCDLDRGKVFMSPAENGMLSSAFHVAYDNAFMASVNTLLNKTALCGDDARVELLVRDMFRVYSEQILSANKLGFEHLPTPSPVPSALPPQLATATPKGAWHSANELRLSFFQHSVSKDRLVESTISLSKALKEAGVQEADVLRALRTLNTHAGADDAGTLAALQQLQQHCALPAAAAFVLARAPAALGALHCVGSCLFHAHPQVRNTAAALLQRVSGAMDEGRAAVLAMGPFHTLTLERQLRARTPGGDVPA